MEVSGKQNIACLLNNACVEVVIFFLYTECLNCSTPSRSHLDSV